MKWTDLVGERMAEFRARRGRSPERAPCACRPWCLTSSRRNRASRVILMCSRWAAARACSTRSRSARRSWTKNFRSLPHWTIHDLRRTARSLMARAGVRPDIAERVLGHAIAGVEGVYDRHTYTDEKAEALWTAWPPWSGLSSTHLPKTWSRWQQGGRPVRRPAANLSKMALR